MLVCYLYGCGVCAVLGVVRLQWNSCCKRMGSILIFRVHPQTNIVAFRWLFHYIQQICVSVPSGVAVVGGVFSIIIPALLAPAMPRSDVPWRGNTGAALQFSSAPASRGNALRGRLSRTRPS